LQETCSRGETVIAPAS